MKRMKDILASLFGKILDIIFPRKGKVRELSLMVDKNELFLLPPLEEQFALRISSLFSYKDPLVRTLIWQIKYKRDKKLIDAVGKLLYEAILADLGEKKFFISDRIILIPIPMSTSRRKERGFNQTEEIAEVIIKMDDEKILEYTSVTLIKTKETSSQTKTKSKRERLENLKNSFSVTEKEKVTNKTIILIDDVITTGSTISEARRVLKEAGAKEIYAYTIAH